MPSSLSSALASSAAWLQSNMDKTQAKQRIIGPISCLTEGTVKSAVERF
jgi:hypothetical protein